MSMPAVPLDVAHHFAALPDPRHPAFRDHHLAAVLGAGVRAHRPIEDGRHRVPDVVFGEDGCRTRRGHAATNRAWLREVALSLLRQDQSQGSLSTKRLRAARDDSFRPHLLNFLCQ